MSTSRLPSAEIGGQKVAPFKDPSSKPYGGFANTTKANEYKVQQKVVIDGKEETFNWASSEAAYHAQKLINLKSRLPKDDPEQKGLTNALRQLEKAKTQPGEEFLPREDFDPIIDRLVQAYPRLGEPGTDDKSKRDAFNSQCVGGDFGKQEEFMREVIKLKLEQNPELKGLAMEMAREGVLPIEFSRYDSKWASGVDGTGKNLLGILILERGNELLREAGETPKIDDPRAAYQALQNTNKDDLTHDKLTTTSSGMSPPVSSGGTTPTPTPTTSSTSSTTDTKAQQLEKEEERLKELKAEAERLSIDLGDKEQAVETAKQKMETDDGKVKALELQYKEVETKAKQIVKLEGDVRDAEVRLESAETNLYRHYPDNVKGLKDDVDRTKDAYDKSKSDTQPDGDPALKARFEDAKQKFDNELQKTIQDKERDDPSWKKTFDVLTESQKQAQSSLDDVVKLRNESKEAGTKLDEIGRELETAKTTAEQSKTAHTQAKTDAEVAKQASVTANNDLSQQQQKVDQLNQSSTPQESKQSEEERKKEEAKKEAEKQKREKEQQNMKKMQFANLYSQKRGWSREEWENIYDPDSNKKDTDKDTPRLSSGSGDDDLETKPGRYRHPKHGGADIRYYEDGSVKPIPPSKFGVWNKDGYGASMDFLAGRLGASTIKISLPMANDPRLKSHNKKQLRELLQMAHKKGLSVEFDSNTMEFLDTLSDKDAKRFLRARDLLAQNAMKNEMLVGAGDTKELNNSKIKAGEGILGGKATEEEYTKSKLDGKTTIDDKLSVVDAELDKLDKHASDMRDLNQRMQSLGKAAEGLLSKPDNLADLHREHIYRTKWQRFKDLIRPNVRENAKRYEDYKQGIADIEKKFEKEKDKRGNLVESIDKKLDKLESLRAQWKKELDTLKADNARKPDSDPGKKKLEEKIKKLEKKLDDIDGKLKEGKKEVAELKKNEQEFKAKIVAAKEKAEEFKASKQAKIGN